MFKFLQPKVLDTITLFHKASNPASIRIATLLKQAAGSGAAVSDNAPAKKSDFELNITEEAPTTEQLRTMLDYVGKTGISSIISNAQNETEALKKFKENGDNLNRPIVVDWNNGKVFTGDNESAILKLLEGLPKKN
ncbi:hypothetical protein NEUTE1DRAFT_92009 [Neurospora tetrasperma FGSC 2508]|uniref:DUF1687-domain-containing protein n=2 Tax=Neurospora TaxID=5140 RepID=A0AAJ0I358_9PEZI|nr:uncharacterized protein NEUTE1DRAFT_92009 [Neurospora tetrasperma FGSC 2508]EGO53067.1 hypothetical protein NEUTE1DRAFT_92009 [Neurospora tetrasperma FGSC 2508]EGZ77908.1 DUF1687-domain-containing protein [Neurospora tetrasperma FGSC 2509]KAK3488873.1 hypothetical protein B0T23DRAFT_187034 [Neurospora hispaniola]